MMGSYCKTSWYEIIIVANFWVMILNLSFFSSFSQPIINNSTFTNSYLLDDYLYNYSSTKISEKARTGVLYNISLPSNFSGMAVSILRLRGSKLWDKGAKFSSIDVRPGVLTMPHVIRVGIMHENLGNWSSYYHDLPGYTFLAPIVGIAMYDATDLSGRRRSTWLGVDIRGGPITVEFHDVRVPKGENMTHLTCVMFNPSSGNLELSNMTRPYVCSWRALGHFGLAMLGPINIAPMPVPSPSRHPMPPSSPYRRRGFQHRKRRKDHGEWKWWVIGFAVGLAGLGLLVLVSVVCYSTIASRKIRKMERKAEKSESLDTIWIGNSRMPSASMTRTQASNLENDSTP